MADYNSMGKDKVMGFFTIPASNSYRRTRRAFTLNGSLENGAPACGEVTLVLDFVAGDGKDTDNVSFGEDTPAGAKGDSLISVRVNIDAINNL